MFVLLSFQSTKSLFLINTHTHTYPQTHTRAPTEFSVIVISSGGSIIKAARLQTPQIVCRNALDLALYQKCRAKSDNDRPETFRTRLFLL